MAFECNICEKDFANRYELRIHMHTHKKERLFQCDKGEKAFTVSRYLKSHKHLHDEERPFKCDKCPKAFKLSKDLKRHFRIHTGEKPFKCNKCPQAFRQSEHLKIHFRIHTGERPFKCNKCSKSFRQSEHLKIHLRFHTGERPFKCNKCSKTFSCSQNLKRHERSHRGETTFKCAKCSKVFTQSEDFKRHELTHIWRPYDFNLTAPIKTHEEEKTLKYHQCDITFSAKDNLKPHTHETRSEDEANHSMQSYANIQASTLIQSEKHSFQYQNIVNQNIVNHSNSSIRFNSLDEITFPHQFIPPNIQTRILPSDIHVKTQGSKNIPMSLLDKSKKHPQKCVSFAAGSIEQMSSISKRREENQFNFDNTLNVFPQYEMPGHRLSLNALPSMHEYQQPNAMEVSFLNTNTGSTPTNRDMESQIHIINLVQNTSDQNLSSSSTQNQESVSTAHRIKHFKGT